MFNLGSTCRIERSTNGSSEYYEIKITESNGQNFKSKSTNLNDNSLFSGEIRTGKALENNIISIKHSMQESDYYGFYIGREVPTGLIRWIGRWVDTDGKSGDFQLVLEN